MTPDNLRTLKNKLLTAKDFKEPWEYFFDHFAENPEFLKLGQQAENSLLSDIIAAIGEKIFRKKITVTNLLLTEVSKYSFFHGACFIQGKVATIIYFKDIDTGLFAISLSAKTHEISLVRFSCIKMDNDKSFFFPSSGSNSIN